MNEKLRKLLEEIQNKKAQVKSLADEGKIEEAKAAKEELKTLQDKFDLLKDIEDPEGDGTIPPAQNTAPVNPKDSTKEFANAARTGFKNTMTEGVQADGGYTVPEDIQTRVNEYRDAKASLIEEVDVEIVSTNKGSRIGCSRSASFSSFNLSPRSLAAANA